MHQWINRCDSRNKHPGIEPLNAWQHLCFALYLITCKKYTYTVRESHQVRISQGVFCNKKEHFIPILAVTLLAVARRLRL